MDKRQLQRFFGTPKNGNCTVHVTFYTKCTPAFLCLQNDNTKEYIRTQSTTHEIILNSENLYSYQAIETIAVHVLSQL